MLLYEMAIDAVVGLQRGDEGKGRFVDMLAEDYDIVARFNGGDNAGHTVILPDGRKLELHSVPSGIAHPETVNVIGSGALINPFNFMQEIEHITDNNLEVNEDSLKVSSAAHLILPHHISMDEVREAGPCKQGSTKSGIGPVMADKVMREGVRVESIIHEPEEVEEAILKGLRQQIIARKTAGLEPFEGGELVENYTRAAELLGSFAIDTVIYVNEAIDNDKKILAEGAQAFLLDVDHGMYPAVTSTSTTTGGIGLGLGVDPREIGTVTGVMKAVQSHVGGGPFVTEITDPSLLTRLHGDMNTTDAEKGTTTGRKRRLGYLDLPQIRRANLINGTDAIALTKLDWVTRFGEEIPVCTEYEYEGSVERVAPAAACELEQSTPHFKVLPSWDKDIQNITNFSALPDNAKRYVETIEDELQTPITMIGVGPRRDQVILR